MLWTDDAALGCIFSLKEQSSYYISLLLYKLILNTY